MKTTKLSASRLACAALGLSALIAGVPAPAQANDMTVKIYYAGVLKAVGTYDDLNDNLCIAVYGKEAAYAVIAIWAVSEPGYGTERVSSTGGAGTHCTGNLSIPEDRYSYIGMVWRGASGETQELSETKPFYT